MEDEWQVTAMAGDVPPPSEEQFEELAMRTGGVVRYEEDSRSLTLVWRVREPFIKAADTASKTAVNALVFTLKGQVVLKELRLVHASVANAS